MSIKTEEIKLVVTTDGERAAADLDKLGAKIKETSTKMKGLNDEMRKSDKAGESNSKTYKQVQSQYGQLEKSLVKYKNEDQKMRLGMDVSALSMNKLKKTASALRAELYNMSPKNDQFGAYKNKLKEVEERMQSLSSRGGKVKLSLGGMFKQGLKYFLPSIGLVSIASKGVEFLGAKVTEVWEKSKQIQAESKKASTVLGDELGYIEAQADKLAKKAGLTNREFVSMTTNVADLLVPLGFSREEAAKMSVETQKLTGALVEWSGGSKTAEDVSQKLTKAMLGEAEGLKELGIGINQGTAEFKNLVKQKIEDQGATEEQAKALTMFELIQRKSVDAQNAYMAGGNELMRTQKEISRGWRQLIENLAYYIATSKEERIADRVRQYGALNQELDKNETSLNSLIPRYEELKDKSNKSWQEQEELKSIVSQIIAIIPTAASEFDEYGRAIGINTGVVEANIRAQKELRKIKDKEFIDDVSSEIKTNIQNVKLLESRIANMQNLQKGGDGYVTHTQGSSLGPGISRYGLYSDDLHKLQGELQAAQKKTHGNISALKAMGLGFDDIGESSNQSSVVVAHYFETIEKAAQRGSSAVIQSTVKVVGATQAEIDATNKAAQERIKLAQETSDKLVSLSDNKELQEEMRYKRELEKFQLQGKDRSNLHGQQLKLYEALEAEHHNNLSSIRSASDQERQKYEQSLRDLIVGLSNNDMVKEQDRYDKKLQSLGLFGADRKKLTSIQLDALGVLEAEHAQNIDKIENDKITKFFIENDKQYSEQLTLMRTHHAEELSEVGESGAKRKDILLRQKLQEKQLTMDNLKDTAADLQNLISGVSIEGIDLDNVILSEEQKKIINKRLQEVALQLAQLKGQSAGEETDGGEDKGLKYSVESSAASADILGMTQDDWDLMKDNFETGKVGLSDMLVIARGLSEAFSMYSQAVAAAENKEFKKYQDENKKKKSILKDRLDAGLISHENYANETARIDEEEDLRQAELERKQAKRNKIQAIFDSIINTALGVTAALSKGGLGIPMAIAVGAAGAIQTAIIAAQPLPGYDKGGKMVIQREQDGRLFDASFDPYKRGYISRPTALVGESGTEYVIPSDGLENPSIASVVGMIEQARIKGSIRNVDILPGRTTGGSLTSTTSYPTPASTSNESSKVLERLTVILDNIERNGVKGVVPLVGKDGIIEGLNKYSRTIIKTTIG